MSRVNLDATEEVLTMLAKMRRPAPSLPATAVHGTPTERRTKRVSLVKGPVGLIGLVLLGYGISAVIFGGHGFGQHAPSGAVHGSTWLGLEVNGWSALLFIAAGLLLLLSAPLHWGAKGMSMIVGLALGITAVIALARGDGALGIFAANHLTELVWGAIAALLLVLSMLPRVGGGIKQRSSVARPVEREPRIVAGEPTGSQVPVLAPLPDGAPGAPVERARTGAGSAGSDGNGAQTRTLVAPASGTAPASAVSERAPSST